VVLKRLSRPEMKPLKKEKWSSTKACKTRNEALKKKEKLSSTRAFKTRNEE